MLSTLYVLAQTARVKANSAAVAFLSNVNIVLCYDDFCTVCRHYYTSLVVTRAVSKGLTARLLWVVMFATYSYSKLSIEYAMKVFATYPRRWCCQDSQFNTHLFLQHRHYGPTYP